MFFVSYLRFSVWFSFWFNLSVFLQTAKSWFLKTALGIIVEKTINDKALKLCRYVLLMVLYFLMQGCFLKFIIQILGDILSQKIQYDRPRDTKLAIISERIPASEQCWFPRKTCLQSLKAVSWMVFSISVPKVCALTVITGS